MKEMKRKAIQELAGYEKALKEVFTERCMSLAEGMLAGFCVIGLISDAEGRGWQSRFQATKKRRR